MRVFFIGAHLPLAGHSVRAPTVVIREALAAFRELGHEVVFQPLLSHDAEEGFEAEGERALEWARENGVELLPALYASPTRSARRRGCCFARRSRPTRRSSIPRTRCATEMAERVDASGADVCFHLWSSAAFGACAEVETPVFAYAGNPDHYSMAARLKHPELFAIPQRTLRNRLKLMLWRRAYRQLRGRRRAARAPLDVDRLRVRAERRLLHREGPPARVLPPEHVAASSPGERARGGADART